MKQKLGQQETQLLAYLPLRKLRTVRTGDLTGPLHISQAGAGTLSAAWREAG